MSTVTTPGAVTAGSLGITAKAILTSTNSTVIWEIPPRVGTLTVQNQITSSAGSYRVEVTASPIDDVSDDTAHWFDVFGTDQTDSSLKAIFSAVTAVKITRVSGEISACIRGQ